MQKQRTEHNYIEILKNSLKDKIIYLNRLIAINEEFEKLVSGESIDYDLFDRNMSEKTDTIKKLEHLDDGFVSVYNRISEVLAGSKEFYGEDIKELKGYIKEVTDLTIKLQISEKSNKELFENRMGTLTNKIKVARTSNKVATNYYQNMAKLNAIEPQFMDKKK